MASLYNKIISVLIYVYDLNKSNLWFLDEIENNIFVCDKIHLGYTKTLIEGTSLFYNCVWTLDDNVINDPHAKLNTKNTLKSKRFAYN